MVQYVRSTRFSVESTLERPNAHSRRLLSRSTSCELVNVKILNGGYEDKTCVRSFTNQITQQLFGPKPLAAEQQTRLDQTEARRAVKILLETGPPPYLRVWMTAAPQPPLPPPLSEGMDPPVSVTSSTRYSELAGSYGIQFKI